MIRAINIDAKRMPQRCNEGSADLSCESSFASAVDGCDTACGYGKEKLAQVVSLAEAFFDLA
jgi:hypothetical protein